MLLSADTAPWPADQIRKNSRLSMLSVLLWFRMIPADQMRWSPERPGGQDMVDIDVTITKPIVKSETKGYTDLQVSQVLMDYSEEYDVDLAAVVALYEVMPNELFDGIRSSLEDMAYWM